MRAAVEHVLGTPRCAHAEQKSRMGLFIRTIGLTRAKMKIGLANVAYNMRRLARMDGRPAPA